VGEKRAKIPDSDVVGSISAAPTICFSTTYGSSDLRRSCFALIGGSLWSSASVGSTELLFIKSFG
jgi:hypothetical protein